MRNLKTSGYHVVEPSTVDQSMTDERTKHVLTQGWIMILYLRLVGWLGMIAGTECWCHVWYTLQPDLQISLSQEQGSEGNGDGAFYSPAVPDAQVVGRIHTYFYSCCVVLYVTAGS